MTDDKQPKQADSTLVSLVSAEQKSKLRDAGVEDQIIRDLPFVPRFSWDAFIWEYRRFLYRYQMHMEDSLSRAADQVDQEARNEIHDRDRYAAFMASAERESMIHDLAARLQEVKLNLIRQRYMVGGIAIHHNQYDRTQNDAALFTLSRNDGVVVN